MKTDVCIITEGTYPYVYGGVSSWIHNLVSSMPDITFSLVNISAQGDVFKSPKYKIPANILQFKEIFVHDYKQTHQKTKGNEQDAWRVIYEFYRTIDKNDFSLFEELYNKLIKKETRILSTHDLLHSKRCWELLTEYFIKTGYASSFVDYFWTMRFIHAPILKIFDATIPDASIYHPVCTGYAGFLAVIAKLEKKSPMILTEHGIYTHERKIEIGKAEWIYTPEEKSNRAMAGMGYLKDLWIKKFDTLSRLAYFFADKIITLSEVNYRMQLEGGADSSKIEIVSNGVPLPEVPRSPYRNNKNGRTRLGFVGRVVPIKDVKTFIRAIKILANEIKNIEVQILGPTDEDQGYFDECQTLIEMLELEKMITFVGNIDVNEYLPSLDVMVLTSVSEGQPLSVLEAMSYGVPIVATDVGACRELVCGITDEDRAVGSSGILTSVGSPQETADAIKTILENPAQWEMMSKAGRERVKRFYKAERMTQDYRNLYETLLQREATVWQA